MSLAFEQPGDAATGIPAPNPFAEILTEHPAEHDVKTQVRCARCLRTIELDSGARRSHIRCGQCHRRLRVSKSIRVPCGSCGCHNEYRWEASGRRMPCHHCGIRIPIPPQLARPVRRRHAKRVPRDASALALVLSLGLSVAVLFVVLQLM